MIYTEIDTFYVTDKQIVNSPAWKDGIDQETEMMLHLYGCELIQESGILLRLYPFTCAVFLKFSIYLFIFPISNSVQLGLVYEGRS